MLPNEPVILAGRQALPDAEALFSGGVKRLGYYNVAWYGTDISDERGAFALVDPLGALASHVGDFLSISYQARSVTCYTIGSVPNLGADVAITRAAFLLLARLTADPLYTMVGLVQ